MVNDNNENMRIVFFLFYRFELGRLFFKFLMALDTNPSAEKEA